MKCYQPILIKNNLDPEEYPNGLLVPCGKCLACKETITKEYTLRFLHELNNWNRLLFVTLTYENKYVPISEYGLELSKDDAKNFIKRLRAKMNYYYKETGQFKYFLTGEYGEKTLRPHYHMVIALPGDVPFELIKSCWKKGNVDIQLAHKEAIFYTIGYVSKKVYNGKMKDYKGKEREFRKMSRGNGREWYEKHKNELALKQYIDYRGYKCGIPRYYKKKLDDEGLWDKEKIKQYQREEKIKETKYILKHYNVKEKGRFNLNTLEYENQVVDHVYEARRKLKQRTYEKKYQLKETKRFL